MKLCSFDARSEGQPGHSLAKGYTKIAQKNALDTRSGRPPSPPSREKMEERWSFDARSQGQAIQPSLGPLFRFEIHGIALVA
jgi:hypothetical protein